MAGVNDRVQGFLNSWAKVKEQLEEIEDEGLFYGNRACRSLRGEPKDDLQAPLGKRNPRL